MYVCLQPLQAILFFRHAAGLLESLTIYVDRTKRVKDARSEAQKEIEQYREKKEEEFKAFEKEVCTNQHVTRQCAK